MGLDDVEVVMNIEAVYGIEIPDQEACKCETVADLCGLVHSILSAESSRVQPRCPGMHVFNRLRRALVRCTELPRNAVRPGAPMNRLCPCILDSSVYEAVAKESGLLMPAWQPSYSWHLVLPLSLAVVWPIVTAIVHPSLFLTPAVPTVAFATCVAGAIIADRLPYFAPRRFPSADYTMADWVRQTLELNAYRLPYERKEWTNDEVFGRISILIAEQVRIPVKDIKPDSRLAVLLS